MHANGGHAVYARSVCVRLWAGDGQQCRRIWLWTCAHIYCSNEQFKKKILHTRTQRAAHEYMDNFMFYFLLWKRMDIVMLTFHKNIAAIYCVDNCSAHARHNSIIRGKLTFFGWRNQQILCMQSLCARDNMEQHGQSGMLANKSIKLYERYQRE